MSYIKSIAFRKAAIEDVDQLYKLLNDLDNKFFHPHRFDKKTLTEICKDNKDHYYVLEVKGRIVGYSMLRLFGTDIPSFGCYIHRHFRGYGYGMMLTRWTLDEAHLMGYKQVILRVHRDNKKAMQMYMKAGFMFADEELRMVHQ